MSVNGPSSRQAQIASLAVQLAPGFEFVAEGVNQKEAVTILAAAGGTGGHIVPALEVAREMRERGHRCVFVGAGRELEQRLTRAAEFPLEALHSGPLNQVSLTTKIRTLLSLPGSLFDALRLIRRYRPAAVLSLGGYASGPLAAAAWLRGVPIVALEPNAYPGMANRLIGPFVARALTGIRETEKHFRRGRTETIGAPVRKEFFEIPIKKHAEPFMILITGGSQGARTLNRAVSEAVQLWAQNGASKSLRILHQAGKADTGRLQLEYASLGSGSVQAEAVEFLDDMPAAFAQADLVISRAGASTVGELCAAGRASILIPYPHAADDHQTHNAEALASAGGAKVVSDAEWNGARMVREIESLLSVPERLEEMEKAARALARPGAARRAADVLEEVAGYSKREGL
jgi:UDP-N-acetylglucosamine--N-acetylmuramyl-(pentapeptide) pyrophosphoryl-undecaprenol N-acetylglucosamine transferase